MNYSTKCEWQPYSGAGGAIGPRVTLTVDQDTGDITILAKARDGKMSQEQKDALVAYFSGKGVEFVRRSGIVTIRGRDADL